MKRGEEGCLESGVHGGWQLEQEGGGKIRVEGVRVRDWGWELEVGGSQPSDQRNMRSDN